MFNYRKCHCYYKNALNHFLGDLSVLYLIKAKKKKGRPNKVQKALKKEKESESEEGNEESGFKFQSEAEFEESELKVIIGNKRNNSQMMKEKDLLFRNISKGKSNKNIRISYMFYNLKKLNQYELLTFIL